MKLRLAPRALGLLLTRVDATVDGCLDVAVLHDACGHDVSHIILPLKTGQPAQLVVHGARP